MRSVGSSLASIDEENVLAAPAVPVFADLLEVRNSQCRAKHTFDGLRVICLKGAACGTCKAQRDANLRAAAGWYLPAVQPDEDGVIRWARDRRFPDDEVEQLREAHLELTSSARRTVGNSVPGSAGSAASPLSSLTGGTSRYGTAAGTALDMGQDLEEEALTRRFQDFRQDFRQEMGDELRRHLDNAMDVLAERILGSSVASTSPGSAQVVNPPSVTTVDSSIPGRAAASYAAGSQGSRRSTRTTTASSAVGGVGSGTSAGNLQTGGECHPHPLFLSGPSSNATLSLPMRLRAWQHSPPTSQASPTLVFTPKPRLLQVVVPRSTAKKVQFREALLDL